MPNCSSGYLFQQQVKTYIAWVNSQTRKYIPYTVVGQSGAAQATVFIGGENPASSRANDSSARSSVAASETSSGIQVSNSSNWMIDNLARDMRDGAVFGIILEVICESYYYILRTMCSIPPSQAFTLTAS